MSLEVEFSRAFALFKSAKRIALIHDSDADGVCAATILIHAFENLFPDKIVLQKTSVTRQFFSSEFLDEAAKKDVDLFISLDSDPINYNRYDDMATHQYFAKKDWHLVVIDHHPINSDTPKNAVRVNPHAFNDPTASKYCTAKLCYDLFVKETDITEYDWLGAAGLIGDHTADLWFDFLVDTAKRNNINFPAKTPNDWFSSPFSKILTKINCARAVGEEAVIKTADIIRGFKTAREAIEANNPFSDVQRTVEDYIRTHRSRGEINEEHEVLWLEINEKYHISSWVSSIISNDNPQMLYLVFHIDGATTGISSRCQSKRVDCGKMMNQITESMDGASGGGHAAAAGAKILTKDFDTFKSNIYKYIEENK